AIEEVVQVLDFGAKKYSPNGWRNIKEEDLPKLLGAALRHIFAYMRGEEVDKQTGVTHIAHATCDLLFLQELKYIIKERENGSKENKEDLTTSV
ncbi:hypothetical protein LCGC14_2433840, partial [marine sediment metagenome]